MSELKKRDGHLINHWYILALEKEVPTDRPIRRTIYDINYVIFRNAKGEIGVMKDYCLHRGAQLSLGKIDQGRLRCPYHGWAYDHQGQVCEIPSEQKVSNPICAKKIPLCIQDSCVWIWTGEDAPTSEKPPWRFPDYQNPKSSQYFMITDFDQNVDHLVQNFMDVPHTVYVHEKWFRKRTHLKIPVTINVANSRVLVQYQQPKDVIGFMEQVLNPEKKPMIHTDEFIFPNITRVDYKFGEKYFIINSQCTPISDFKTRVYTWIAYDIGIFTKILTPFMKFYTRQVIQQDVEIMKNQGDNMKIWGPQDYKSTSADELHLAIEKMRLLGTKDSAGPQSMTYQREREFWI